MQRIFLFLLVWPPWLFAQNLDTRLTRHINANSNTAFDPFNIALERSADVVAIGTPLVLWASGFQKKDERLKKQGIQAGVAALGTYGLVFLLKKTINRDRPFISHPSIVPVRVKRGSSMPSGSTALAFSAATSWTTAFPKWYVAVPAYGYATAVGYSRIRSGEHYPSDVLVGAVLGTTSVWVSGKLMKWMNK